GAHHVSPSLPTRRSSDLMLLPSGKDVSSKGSMIPRWSDFFYIFIVYHEQPCTLGQTHPSRVNHFQKSVALRNNRKLQLTYQYKRSEEHTSELQSRFDLVC